MDVLNKNTFTEFLLSQGVLKFGDFTLKDGSKSPFFLDFGALATGGAFRQVGSFFNQVIEEKVGFDKIDFLHGPPYKAVMLAGACALTWSGKDMPCLFSRKEAKQHGEGGNFFGHQPKPGEGYVLVDDVMSSGGTKVQALEMLKGYKCLGVVVGVDRQHEDGGVTAAERFTQETGVPVYSVIKLKSLCLSLDGLIEASKYQAMKEFCGL